MDPLLITVVDLFVLLWIWLGVAKGAPFISPIEGLTIHLSTEGKTNFLSSAWNADILLFLRVLGLYLDVTDTPLAFVHKYAPTVTLKFARFAAFIAFFKHWRQEFSTASGSGGFVLSIWDISFSNLEWAISLVDKIYMSLEVMLGVYVRLTEPYEPLFKNEDTSRMLWLVSTSLAIPTLTQRVWEATPQYLLEINTAVLSAHLLALGLLMGRSYSPQSPSSYARSYYRSPYTTVSTASSECRQSISTDEE